MKYLDSVSANVRTGHQMLTVVELAFSIEHRGFDEAIRHCLILLLVGVRHTIRTLGMVSDSPTVGGLSLPELVRYELVTKATAVMLV